MIKLLVTNRSSGDTRQYQFSQNTITLGRQTDCDVPLETSGASRKHAAIFVTKNLVELEDLGSGNGTTLNQIRIPSKERYPLKTGDKIRIEDIEIDVQIESATPKAVKFDSTDPDIIEIKMIKKVLGALDQDKQPCLIVTSEPFANKKAMFDDAMEELVIGRDPECQLFMDSHVVSRRHAIISIKWGGFSITDLSSKNGTFVNGERIQEKMLRDGDEIVFGTLKAYFKNPRELDIDALSRSIVESKDKSKISPVTQAVPTGEPLTENPSATLEMATSADIPKPMEPADPKAIKPETEATPTKAEDKSSSAENLEKAKSKTSFPKPNPLEFLMQRFSILELALFGLGGIIFLLALGLLLAIFL